MVIVGASGHAKEVFDICQNTEDLFFFDNVWLHRQCTIQNTI